METLLKLQNYMGRRKILLPGALIISAFSALVGMAPYILIWLIIRAVLINTTEQSSDQIAAYAWWAVTAAIISVILYFAALSLSHLAAFRAETSIRKSAMQKIVRMPLGFFDSTTTGKIRKIIDDNAGITHSFLAHQMPDLAATIIMPLAAMVLILIFNPVLGLVCLIPVALAMLIMGSMSGKRGRYFMNTYMTSLEEMNTEAVEYVRGIPVVKVFQQTVYSFKNFYSSIIKYKNMVFQYADMCEKPMSAYTVLINGFGFFLIPAAIIIINRSGDITGTLLDLILYLLITPVFSQSIMRSMYLNQAFGQAKEAITRVENLLDTKPLPEVAKPKQLSGYNISFHNVTFSYPGTTQKAVDNISLEIPRGQTVALVGASGSGKTTLARLIPRFWDADQGSVCIGGTDVKELSQQDLMQNISFVFQNTRLFKTTLRENICYGNLNATDEQIFSALEQAKCLDIILKLPAGLNTKIGSDGTYLSGGEQQRIILARAILKNAPVVVLDEATAFTDPENEHLIQEALKKLTVDKTVLMIAHRLTSIVDANLIAVVKDGVIAERGTHEELLKKNCLYAGMWNDYRQSVQWTVGKEATCA